MSCAGIPAYYVQRANFHKKWKWWIYNIFAFLCIFDVFLNFWGCFFVESLPNPVAMPELSNWSCCHARTFQLVLSPCQNFPPGQPATFQLISQQRLATINNKNPKILTKRLPVATTVPSGTQHHHCIFDGFLNYWGCFLLKAYQTLSKCQNFPTGPVAMPELSNWPCRHARTFQLALLPCQNFPTGPVAMPELSNRSCCHAKTFQLVLAPCQNSPTGQPAKLGKY